MALDNNPIHDVPAPRTSHSSNGSTATLKKAPPTGDAAKLPRRLRQPSLRRTNSVELTHKRMQSSGSAHGLPPDGASGSREGRQFTVANVGTNGMIYLRPVARPLQHRIPQPLFTFPEAVRRTSHDDPSRRPSSGAASDSMWSGSRTPHTSTRPKRRSRDIHQGYADSPLSAAGRRRAHSVSDDQENEREDHRATLTSGLSKVRKPRPRTAEYIPGPLHEVPIPHYRIGSPRFSARGTPILRSSVYTRTSTNDEQVSSDLSDLSDDQFCPMSPALGGPARFSRGPYPSPSSPSKKGVARIASMSLPTMQHPVDPRVFEGLTFPPSSDDASVVRYSPSSRSITAATPLRLIAQITSPSFLDYDLLSDFFLTYRSFLSPHDLATFLMARLQWAINRHDDIGKIVKVRSFVAMRHWILNYFMDDFVPDYNLRTWFCSLMHNLCSALNKRPDGGVNHFKLVGELKKCWRRTCELYWDSPVVSGLGAAYEDIHPGGPIGTGEDPYQHLIETVYPVIEPPVSDGRKRATFEPAIPDQLSRDHEGVRSRQNQWQTEGPVKDRTMSASSELSMHVTSCSFPAKGFKQTTLLRASRAGAHPVLLSPAASSASKEFSFSREPRAISSHRRSISFTDALRDERSPRPQPTAPSVEPQLLLSGKYAGGLIRGNLVLPTQALLDPPVLETTIQPRFNDPMRHQDTEIDNVADPRQATVTGPGVRKLIGSVRRALGNRHVGDSGENVSSSTLSETRSAQTIRTEPARPRSGRGKADRNDLLHVAILSDFKQVYEAYTQTLMDAAKQITVNGPGRSPPQEGLLKPDETSRANNRTEGVPSMVSTGSKSIVIIDDTGPPPVPKLPGDLAILQQGDQNQTFPQGAAKDYPTQTHATPESFSSHVPSIQDALARSFSFERLSTQAQSYLEDGKSRKTSCEITLSAQIALPLARPSSRPGQSVILRKYASFQSGMTRLDGGRSFDATTATGSDTASIVDGHGRSPARMLRRRPGGDLRAAQNITDLELSNRPISTGSLTTCSGSLRDSKLAKSGSRVTSAADGTHASEVRRRFSLGALAEVQDKDDMSLVRTHSSQPNLRPSFEVEVAKLARLPDDEDDGGVESTLLKLEGRFERRLSDESPLENNIDSQLGANVQVAREIARAASSNSGVDRDREHDEIDRDRLLVTPADVAHPGSVQKLASGPHESYSSIPLLERRSSERFSQGVILVHKAVDDSRPQSETKTLMRGHSGVSHLSIDSVDETESVREMALDGTHPNRQNLSGSFLLGDDEDDDDDGDGDDDNIDEEDDEDDDDSDEGSGNDDQSESFLLDEDEDLSDLSSEMSIEILSSVDRSSQDSHPLPLSIPGTMIFESGLISHPLRHPPTPPFSAESALRIAPPTKLERFANPPPTPESSPIGSGADLNMINLLDSVENRMNAADQTRPRVQPSAGTSAHLPFILAFDADLIAQQMTLCERDALAEIDWRDLVEIRWSQNLPDVRNWVQYLSTQQPSSVELVIARFNIMVKWATSEIVMTQNIEERARTIAKFIQIAAYARKYHNYATLYQLTVAFSSIDCSRLTDTWKLVPQAEVQMAKELEALIQPVRNFHALRIEMETASTENGCIPFIGIYTHDLVFNSHRPLTIPANERGDLLVNFERHRTTAAVVKNLLRLLESSNKYDFKPVQGVIDRCLWVCALSDNEIRSRSKGLQ